MRALYQGDSNIMPSQFRKILLAGTALVAVAAFSAPAQAVVEDHQVVGATTWASAGTQAQVALDGTDALFGDNVDITATTTLTVTNNTIANDGSVNTNTFALGTVTNSANTGALMVTTGTTATLAVTLDSVDVTGNVTFKNHNAANAQTNVVVTDDLTVGDVLAITNAQATTNGKTVTVDVGGDLVVTGATTVTGAVGAGGGANASLSVAGSTVTFGGGIALTDATGTATLTLNGTALQTVTGDIDGATNKGAVVISNTSAAGVTFLGELGVGATLKTITLSANTTGATATFGSDVFTASGLVIGDGGGTVDAYTVNFNTTGGDIDVQGIVDGAATDTATVNITGGNTVTTNAAWGGGALIEAVTLSGTGTELVTGAALTATKTTVGAGSILTTGGAVTGAIDISGALGTVALGDNFGVTGAIDNTSGSSGVGVLTSASTIGNTSTVGGAVGATNALQSVTLTGAGTFAFSNTVRAATIEATTDGGVISFANNVTGDVHLSADATVTLASGRSITGDVDNTAGIDSKGTLAITANATNTIFGDVGATHSLKEITIAGTGVAAFGSTVNADDVTFNGATTATFAGDVLTANGIDFNNQDGTVTFSDTASLTGNVLDSAAGKGTVEFSGNSTVVGNLGSGGTGIEAVNFNGGTDDVVTISGTIVATTLTVNGVGSVGAAGNVTGNLAFSADGAFGLAAGKTITGSVDNTTGADGAGTLAFAGNGTLTGTFGATDALKALTLNGTGTAGTNGVGTLVSLGTIVPNMIAADDTALNGNTLAVTGTVAVAANQTINTTINSAITGGLVLTGGNITATGNVTVNANSFVDITFDTSDFIANGATFKIIDGTGGVGVATLVPANITDNSFLLSFEQDAPGGADLIVHVERPLLATVSSTTNGDAVGAALDSLGIGGGDEILAIQTNLNTAETAAEVDEILESLVPTVDGGAFVAMLSMGGQTQGIIDTRMAALYSRDGMTGMAAGASGNGGSYWAQGYGHGGVQELQGDIDGYHSATWGGAMGVDTIEFFDRASVGFAVNYGRTIVRSENVNTTTTTLDNIGVHLYGNVDSWWKMFVDGQVGYAYNKIASERHNIGLLNDTAQADYQSNQYMAKIALGRNFAATGGMTLTPSASAAYTRLDTAGYIESEAGGASLIVAPSAISSLDLGGRLQAAWRLKYAGMGGYNMPSDDVIKPSLHVGYYYDAIGDTIEHTATFVGGGSSFTATGSKPAQGRLNAGAGLSFTTSSDWGLSANYDYDYKTGYNAHSGVVRLISYF